MILKSTQETNDSKIDLEFSQKINVFEARNMLFENGECLSNNQNQK